MRVRGATDYFGRIIPSVAKMPIVTNPIPTTRATTSADRLALSPNRNPHTRFCCLRAYCENGLRRSINPTPTTTAITLINVSISHLLHHWLDLLEFAAAFGLQYAESNT